MTSLTLAALFFVGIHVFISGTRLRDAIAERVGERAFLGLFSLLSLGGFAWLVVAYRAAPFVTVWPSPIWFRPVALVLVFVATVLVVVGLTTPSPTAVGGERALEAAEPATGILRVSRHPFLTGVGLWAATHVVASGDAAGLVLFGTVFVLAAIGPSSIDRKRARKLGARWDAFARKTSILPFAAIAAGRNRFVPGEIGAWRIAAACAVFAILLAAHAPLFGVSPLAF